MLREPQLDLTKCVNVCRASELAELQTKKLEDETNVHIVKKTVQKSGMYRDVDPDKDQYQARSQSVIQI